MSTGSRGWTPSQYPLLHTRKRNRLLDTSPPGFSFQPSEGSEARCHDPPFNERRWLVRSSVVRINKLPDPSTSSFGQVVAGVIGRPGAPALPVAARRRNSAARSGRTTRRTERRVRGRRSASDHDTSRRNRVGPRGFWRTHDGFRKAGGLWTADV